jgi:endogenous inhibitor of DNA gyrase (YacG/DUF329 family)
MIRNLFGPHGAARSYRCCICDRETEYWGPTPSVYPFCSPRCKLVDLGKWLREQYSVDGDLGPDDLTRGPTPGRPPRGGVD